MLILDFGSQYTQLIARRIREQGVYCEIRPCTDAPPASLVDGADGPELPPGRLVGVVLSGGPSSVYDDDAPPFDDRWLQVSLPVLGVCYGMQLLAQGHGGTVARASRREYGKATIALARHDAGDAAEALFSRMPARTVVWMSHGDHVEVPPDDWHVLASSDNCPVAAMGSPDGQRLGIQFHPEVTHTEHGEVLVHNFLFAVCGARANWSMGSFIDEQVEAIRARVGDGHVICGLSGGVDSAVVAAPAAPGHR